jgi:hypothetical protein
MHLPATATFWFVAIRTTTTTTKPELTTHNMY